MRQLTERDRDAILEYVGVEPEANIFFIGDVESFGVDSAAVSIWAGGQGAHWDSLVLRYTNDYVVYSRNADYGAGEVSSFLKTQNVGMISGKYELVARLKPYFPERRLRSMFLTKCEAVKEGFDVPDGCELRTLTVGDAETLADLLLGIDEFSASYHDRETTVRKLRTSLGCGSTCCGAYIDGALVACAQAAAENSKSAMVVGVATRRDVRGRGYASAVVSALCRESFRKGKQFLCLFYDNPAAGRIYNRIGFEPFGKYALLEKRDA